MPHLHIECTNLRTQDGQVIAVVWNKQEHFRSDDPGVALHTVKAPASAGSVTLTIEDLPAAQYAVAVLHDENDNDRLDVTRLLELPMEGMGFSNNPPMGLKGPTWEGCAFDHTADSTISIALKYWR